MEKARRIFGNDYFFERWRSGDGQVIWVSFFSFSFLSLLSMLAKWRKVGQGLCQFFTIA